MEQQLFTIIQEQQLCDKKYMIWIKRIDSKRPRVVCYWNTIDVIVEKFKWNVKGRTKKTIQTMQLNKENEENWTERREKSSRK